MAKAVIKYQHKKCENEEKDNLPGETTAQKKTQE